MNIFPGWRYPWLSFNNIRRRVDIWQVEPRGDGGEVEEGAFIFKFTTARLIFKAVSILVRQLGRLVRNL